ncbi:uncharacterized protein Z519_08181 [Cladophialophora bantiana CBS 173.52]|uniref:Uncharacterized protein n=1 Tax=Cladophialophora bantiana (strain ATCC 10958 / CBS 173.52 / CDC B-1940 / NIH 8579) TaxID=1442370 RepID=A0A0D2HKI4_CLAB1|nr:uncharacterized protein Z519_08181 [Cladophialophora bantiana CBS 173.52]KIW91285.1 hypothetical protein Z519_08181 [Cladophialophora bantiana CBS 173.52]
MAEQWASSQTPRQSIPAWLVRCLYIALLRSFVGQASCTLESKNCLKECTLLIQSQSPSLAVGRCSGMTKEDLLRMGKHLQIIDVAQYPAQIAEGNAQLVNHPLNGSSPEEAEKWKHIERARMNDGEIRSAKDDTPWHAIAAVKKEVPKKHAS